MVDGWWMNGGWVYTVLYIVCRYGTIHSMYNLHAPRAAGQQGSRAAEQQGYLHVRK